MKTIVMTILIILLAIAFVYAIMITNRIEDLTLSAGEYPTHKEPVTFQCDVIFRFHILSENGKNIRNVIETHLNKPSEFIRTFPPLYEIIENENSFQLQMYKAPFKTHHELVIELLTNNGFVPDKDYILTWITGQWNRKTKEFNLNTCEL